MSTVQALNGGALWVPEKSLGELTHQEEVLWIEEAAPPLTPNNDGARAQMQSDPLLAAPYSLSGSGVRLFVYDGGQARPTHETFNPGTGSRVTSLDATAVSEHATHTAGTAAGDGSGSTGGKGKGVAPSTTVLTAGIEWTPGTMPLIDTAGDIETDYASARNTHSAAQPWCQPIRQQRGPTCALAETTDLGRWVLPSAATAARRGATGWSRDQRLQAWTTKATRWSPMIPAPAMLGWAASPSSSPP